MSGASVCRSVSQSNRLENRFKNAVCSDSSTVSLTHPVLFYGIYIYIYTDRQKFRTLGPNNPPKIEIRFTFNLTTQKYRHERVTCITAVRLLFVHQLLIYLTKKRVLDFCLSLYIAGDTPFVLDVRRGLSSDSAT